MAEKSADEFAETKPASLRGIRSILIIRMGAFGDIIHTLPALELLHTALDEAVAEEGKQGDQKAAKPARIDWLVKPVWAPLLEGHPAVDEVFRLPPAKLGGGPAWLRKWRGGLAAARFVRSLRAQNYDLVLDLQGNTKSGFFARLLHHKKGGRRRIVGFGGPESRELNRLFIRERYTAPESARHVVEKNAFLAARALGIDSAPSPPLQRFRLPSLPAISDILKGEEALRNEAYPRIALNPGAGWEAKRWPPRLFAALILRLKQRWPNADIRLTLGPGEESLAESIRQELLILIAEQSGQDASSLLTPLRVLPLLELASYLREAEVYVGGDTGPTHLAAAVGTPVVAIFGEWPAERNGPWPNKVDGRAGKITVLEAETAPGAGGKVLSRSRQRPIEGFPIEQITPSQVFESICDLIE